MIYELRERIQHLEGAAARPKAVLPFGVGEIDEKLPGGGLAWAALIHEFAGGGAGAVNGAVAALFVAGIAARTKGTVVWCLARVPIFFAPALAQTGLHPDRVIYVEAAQTWGLVLGETTLTSSSRVNGDPHECQGLAGADLDGIQKESIQQLPGKPLVRSAFFEVSEIQSRLRHVSGVEALRFTFLPPNGSIARAMDSLGCLELEGSTFTWHFHAVPYNHSWSPSRAKLTELEPLHGSGRTSVEATPFD